MLNYLFFKKNVRLFLEQTWEKKQYATCLNTKNIVKNERGKIYFSEIHSLSSIGGEEVLR